MAVRLRLLSMLALAVLIGGVVAGTALAYRRARAAERAGMKAALTPRDCVANSVHIKYAFVSTVNPRYGQADCGDLGHFALFLHRPSARSERWHVVFEIGDNAVACASVRRHLPEAVIRDLRIGGLSANGNGIYC